MFDNQNRIVTPAGSFGVSTVQLQPLMRSVYMWMTIGLSVTGFIAMSLATAMQNDVNLFIGIAQAAPVLMLVQLGIVLGLSFMLNRLSPTWAIGLFIVYAITMGVSMSAIILSYIADWTVVGDRVVMNADWMIAARAFFTAAGLFGAMTVIGYTTKIDLSRFSTFFIMGLIGLVIAGLLNAFLFRSSGMDLVISVFGVLIFTGITAWDTQRIKEMAAVTPDDGSATYTRLAIMGALMLYLDFINLFLYLLRLFARRD